MSNNIKTVLEIGGKVSESVRSAFSSVDSKIKSIGTSIKSLNGTQLQIQNLAKEQDQLASLRKAYIEARKSGDEKSTLKAKEALDKKAVSVTALTEKLRKAGVNTSKLSEEMDRLGRQSSAAADKMGKLKKATDAFEALKSGAGKVAAVGATVLGAATAIGTGAFLTAKAATDQIDDLADAAAGLGIGDVNELLGMQHVFKGVGIEAEQTNVLISKLNNAVEDSKDPASKSAKSLALLGLSYSDLEGRDPATQMRTIAEAFKNYHGTVKASTIATDLFGKQGWKALGALKDGSDAFSKAQEELKASGLEITPEMLAGASKFEGSWLKLGAVFDGIKLKVGSKLMEPLIQSMDAIAKLILDIYSFLRPLFRLMSSVVKWIGDFIGWKNVLGAIAVVAMPLLVAGISGLIGLMVTLAPLIAAVTSSILSMSAAIFLNPIGLAVAGIVGAALLIYKYWEPIKAFFIDLWDSITIGFTKFWDFIGPWGQGILTVLFPVIAAFKAIKAVAGFFGIGGNSGEPKNQGDSVGASALSSKGASIQGRELSSISPKETNITNAPTINVQVATNADPHQIGQEVSRSFQSGLLNTGSLNA